MWKIILLICLLTGFLVTIWFKDGYILGGSEDGLIFYDISRYFHQAEYTWMEYPGLGNPSLTLIAGKPTYFLLSSLQRLGIPGFLIQAGVFYFLVASSGIGIYLLSKELFPKLPIKYIFLSILFYWFNPISLAALLNRSLLNYIFFFALLPLASYFYIKGLRSRVYFWALALSVLIILYSYAFSYVAFTILLWFWLSLVTFYFILFNKQKIFALKYFFLSLLLFMLSSSWWILPLLVLNISGGTSPTSNLFSSQTNIDTLSTLSKSMGNLTEIFKLINSSFLSTDSLSWVKVYYSSILFIIQYFFVGAILFFIIKSRKDSASLFLGSLFLTSIFLAKGNNPPFGEIYNLMFKNIVILQVFRNPFEKFSFLLSLTSSILVGPSIYLLLGKLQSSLRQVFYFLILAVLVLYLGFPLYSGLALTNKFPPTNNYSIGYKVKVPQYYKQADEWLAGQGNNFRYIGFPIKLEGITYSWEKGYAGVELSVALFRNSGILLNTSVPFFNQIIPEIEKTLLSDKDFSLFANLVNAKYYLLRYDIDYKTRGMTDPLIIEEALKEREKKGEVKKVVTFGSVDIWENLKWRDDTFYAAKKLIKVDNFDNADPLLDIDVLSGEALIDKDGLNKLNKVAEKLSDSSPLINYSRINSTKYLLHLRNVTKPFILVFSELYNTDWKANYTDKKTNVVQIRANLYGNGWVIDREGDFDMVIEFMPQKWMDVGEKISIASIVLIIGGMCFLSFKYKTKKGVFGK